MKKVVVVTGMICFLLYGSAGAIDKIRIGVPQQIVHWMVFPLAQQKGFFKAEGFDAEIVRITGPSGRSALMSGDIDYYTTIAFIVQSVIVGLPVKVVAAYCINDATGIQIGSGSEGQNHGDRRAARQLTRYYCKACVAPLGFECRQRYEICILKLP